MGKIGRRCIKNDFCAGQAFTDGLGRTMALPGERQGAE